MPVKVEAPVPPCAIFNVPPSVSVLPAPAKVSPVAPPVKVKLDPVKPPPLSPVIVIELAAGSCQVAFPDESLVKTSPVVPPERLRVRPVFANPVPPFFPNKMPVTLRVDPVPVVVSPVVPPLIVTTPPVGVIEPLSASMVVIAPEALTDWNEGSDVAPFEVKMNPAVDGATFVIVDVPAPTKTL
jgi:hypothetical protein